MQSIYFTALICYLPLRQNPPKTNQQQKTKKKYKPQSDPPSSLPDPNTFLKYLSAHSKHLFCFLAEAGDINHTGGEGGKEGGRWSSRRGGGIFFLKKCIDANSVCTRSISPPPHQMKANFKNKQIWSKLTWFEWLHSENDIWFTYRWGYNTHTRTHRLPHKLIYT